MISMYRILPIVSLLIVLALLQAFVREDAQSNLPLKDSSRDGSAKKAEHKVSGFLTRDLNENLQEDHFRVFNREFFHVIEL